MKYFSLALLILLLAACGMSATPSATVSLQPPAALTPTATPWPTRTLTSTATPKTTLLPPTEAGADPTIPSRTPRPSRTPTATLPPPVAWNVPAAEIPEWITETWEISWVGDQRIRLDVVRPSYGDRIVDISASGATSLQPMPTPFQGLDPETLVYSPQGTYVVTCIDPDPDQPFFYRGLQLYRTSDGRMVSQVKDKIIQCRWAISWARDESVMSLLTATDEIYAWKPNGSAPYFIGRADLVPDPGHWSPDGKRLVVEFQLPEMFAPSYRILYADGRPAKELKVELGVRSEPGLNWLTNTIVHEDNSCCATCSFHDYYVAETGEPLPEISWQACSIIGQEIHHQAPLLSPDQRWFVLDQNPHMTFWIEGSQQLNYTLYDFQSRQPYTLSATSDLYLDFTGWADDSGTFYFTRTPLSSTVSTSPDVPFGLLALDPLTRQVRLLAPEVHYAWLSPDRQHFFGLSQGAAGYLGGIYDLNGKLVSKLQSATDTAWYPGEWRTWAGRSAFRLAWSNNSRQVAFVDALGNLWLLGLDGEVRQLASNLPASVDTFLLSRQFLLWAPGDERLLVLAGSRAWVLDLSGLR